MLKLKSPWQALKDSSRSARFVAIASAGAAATCGQIEDGAPAAPINAVSHLVYGDESFDQIEPSLKYTGAGYMAHESAIRNWAILHEIFFGNAKDEGKIGISLLGGVLVSGLAYLVDYHAVPEKYKPGFERHLMPRSILVIYLVLALGLGLIGLKRSK